MLHCTVCVRVCVCLGVDVCVCVGMYTLNKNTHTTPIKLLIYSSI